jgi:predicted flavoprotein YhiN
VIGEVVKVNADDWETVACEIEGLVTAIEGSGGCEVEISSAGGDNGSRIEIKGFAVDRFAGLVLAGERGRLEGHWIA